MADRAETIYFQQETLWHPEVQEQKVVATDLLAMIPADVKTILDAGCGNGVVTNRLIDRWQVVGCDISPAAMSFVKAPTFVADLSDIPRQDREFDLVLASDVIEHLPDKIYEKALGEIARVANRYVLIAVPYNEILAHATVVCPYCGHHYHAHHHQRTYTFKSLFETPLPEFTPVQAALSGARWVFGNPDLVTTERVVSGLDYPFEDALCPQCSQRRGAVPAPPIAAQIRRKFEALQAMSVASGLSPIPDQSELLMLFERNAATPCSEPTDWAVTTFFRNQTFRLSKLDRTVNPMTYANKPVLVGPDNRNTILSLPGRPHDVIVVSGSCSAIDVFDSVRQVYVSCSRHDHNRFTVPARPFGPHGCLLRISDATPDLELRAVAEPPHTMEGILDVCFGDAALKDVLDENLKLRTNAGEMENLRARLEFEFAALQSANAGIERQYNAALSLTETLESRRAKLESDYSALQSENATVEAKLNDALALAETLEEQRSKLEAAYSSALSAHSSVEKRLNAALALSESLEKRRASLEKDYASMQSAHSVVEEKFGAALALTETLETQRVSLESKLTEMQTSLNETSTKLHAANARASELEQQSRRLSAELSAAAEEASAIERATRQQLASKQAEMDLLRRTHADAMTLAQRQISALEICTVANERHPSAAKPRRILVLSHMYPRASAPVSGIFVHEQVKELRKKGLDVRVMSGEPFWINTANPLLVARAMRAWLQSSDYDWIDFDGVPVVYFPYIVSSPWLSFEWHATTYRHAARRALARLKVPFDFEIVHAHTAYLDGTGGADIAKERRVPLVITEHTGPFRLLTRTPYLKRRTEASLRCAERVVSVSEALLGSIKQDVNLSKGANPLVVPNLVDTSLFTSAPARNQDTIVALWVGHFVPIKRVDVLLRAFKRAYGDDRRLRLRLVGDGELEHDLRALAGELELTEVVEFCGRADRSELSRHYHDCDFLVISSEAETFGVVAIEALSSGRPVLTTKCGGPSDVVTSDQLGEVVDLDLDALATGLLTMAKRLDAFDPELLREVALRRFSGTVVADQILRIYAEAIADYSPSRS